MSWWPRQVCEREEVNGEDLAEYFRSRADGKDTAINPLYMPDFLGLNEIQVIKLQLSVSKIVGK